MSEQKYHVMRFTVELDLNRPLTRREAMTGADIMVRALDKAVADKAKEWADWDGDSTYLTWDMRREAQS